MENVKKMSKNFKILKKCRKIQKKSYFSKNPKFMKKKKFPKKNPILLVLPERDGVVVGVVVGVAGQHFPFLI